MNDTWALLLCVDAVDDPNSAVALAAGEFLDRKMRTARLGQGVLTKMAERTLDWLATPTLKELAQTFVGHNSLTAPLGPNIAPVADNVLRDVERMPREAPRSRDLIGILAAIIREAIRLDPQGAHNGTILERLANSTLDKNSIETILTGALTLSGDPPDLTLVLPPEKRQIFSRWLSEFVAESGSLMKNPDVYATWIRPCHPGRLRG